MNSGFRFTGPRRRAHLRWSALPLVIWALFVPGPARASGGTHIAPGFIWDEELANAIREVANGKNYVSPLVTNRPEEPLTLHTQKATITPRQREVLELISRGLTMKEIASQLNISTRTAESHKYEMMQTLGVESTAELIRYSLRLGLIS